jgi:hypothetical protein
MLRHCIAATLLSACAGLAQTATDLSGTWGFTHADDRFQGWIVIRQSGSTFSGTWHTSKGKVEPDDDVTGRIDGNAVTLWRFIGENRQSFDLTLSPDGKRLDGFGEGFFLNHTNLSMERRGASGGAPATPVRKDQRKAAAPRDVSGLWTFTHFNDRFQGTVTLRQEGSDVTGTWHTSKGKMEPDDGVSGRIEGNTFTLWRFIGNAQQHYVLTLSPDGTRLDGYGNGYFLNHTNLNMARVVEASTSASATPPQSK